LPRRIGGVRAGSASIIYGLGPAGRRLLARTGFESRPLRAPGERYIRHTLAITELVVRLAEADRAGTLELLETQTEPQCWRGFLGVLGERVVLKPDLFLRVGAGGVMEDRWAVEVDLATEARPTIRAKAERYLAHYRSGEEQRQSGIYPRVIWAVPDWHRGGHVRDALSSLPSDAEPLFVIWPYDEVVGRIIAEARS
jgi:hypothetical protein